MNVADDLRLEDSAWLASILQFLPIALEEFRKDGRDVQRVQVDTKHQRCVVELLVQGMRANVHLSMEYEKPEN